jgi:hypothetical protein
MQLNMREIDLCLHNTKFQITTLPRKQHRLHCPTSYTNKSNPQSEGSPREEIRELLAILLPQLAHNFLSLHSGQLS